VIDDLRYDGRRVIVTGAASGMGEAAARLLGELGAEVHAFDIMPVSVPVKQAVEVDLIDPAAIDAAVARVGGPIHALLNVAALPGPPHSDLDTFLVDFAGTRHLTERVLEHMSAGAAIANVSSVGGLAYLTNQENVRRALAAKTFDEARVWAEAHPEINNGYEFSKQCLNLWAQLEAAKLGPRGIRVNTVSPGLTHTPMLDFVHADVGEEGRAWMDRHYLGPAGRYGTPMEQGWPLVFLCSDAASFISGANLYVDGGYSGALVTGAIEPPDQPPWLPS
jgi:NAD(P)-dependent dehydrogenase (short-subunit alcohol dehydrogenase family)